jgi:hypothetical protein
MLKVYKIYPSGFASNSYAVTKDGKTCAVIDCAQERVWDKCAELGLVPQAVLLTHGHYDHIGGCARFIRCGVPVYASEEEADNMFTPPYTSLSWYKIEKFPIKALRGGQTVTVAGIDFKVISTPGHTSGGVCYLAEDCLFTGDTLFLQSIGRSDLPTGSYSQLVTSVKKLYALPGDYKVYCGHEEDTTLAYERANNAFVRGEDA